VNSQKQEDTGGSRYGKVGNVYWGVRGWIYDKVPDSYVSNSGIVSGEQYGLQVSSIAYPEDQNTELLSMTESQLFVLLNTRFGFTTVQRESIGNVNWVIISGPTY
jgi:hypothetical protein